MNQKPALLAQLKVMAREATNDVRGTIHETFFSKPEHAPEVGTPMNPTQYMQNNELLGKEQERGGRGM